MSISTTMVPRVLGRLGPDGPGPTLVCIGSLHGNEPSGVVALQRVVARLTADPTGLVGRFLALSGNRKARSAGQRYLVEDLNRIWLQRRVERARGSQPDLPAEDEELRELDRELRRAYDECRGTMFVVDLHSTSGPGTPFVTFDDTLAIRDFACSIPAPGVLGLEEELAGTLTSFLVSRGLIAIGFESGQHDDPASVDHAEEAIWIALEHAGVLRAASRPEVAEARARLSAATAALPTVVEVRYRHPVESGNGFAMHPGYRTFQRIDDQLVLAEGPDGPVTAPLGGLLLMPLYQDQGEDGFFVVRSIHPLWLKLSAALRKLRVDAIVHWLPGVARHPRLEHTFLVDRGKAVWLSLQLFHLLGYRRRARPDHILVMTRRDNAQHEDLSAEAPSSGARAQAIGPLRDP